MGSKQVVNRMNDIIGPLLELDTILCTLSRLVKEIISDINISQKNNFDHYPFAIKNYKI